MAPGKLLIFACPSCGFRSPVKDVESGKAFEWACMDKKCGNVSLVILDGYESSVAVENGGKADQSVA